MNICTYICCYCQISGLHDCLTCVQALQCFIINSEASSTGRCPYLAFFIHLIQNIDCRGVQIQTQGLSLDFNHLLCLDYLNPGHYCYLHSNLWQPWLWHRTVRWRLPKPWPPHFIEPSYLWMDKAVFPLFGAGNYQLLKTFGPYSTLCETDRLQRPELRCTLCS